MSTTGTNAMPSQAKSASGMVLNADRLDAGPYALCAPAGIVDLRTGRLSAPDPNKDFPSRPTPVGPRPTPIPRWTRFLHSPRQRPQPARSHPPAPPGDVLLVDEAGMAGTLLLDAVLADAAAAGAVVRLLGDPNRLAAVEAGGALRLISRAVGAIEPDQPHRFRAPGEADAFLTSRDSDKTRRRITVTSRPSDCATLQEGRPRWVGEARDMVPSVSPVQANGRSPEGSCSSRAAGVSWGTFSRASPS